MIYSVFNYKMGIQRCYVQNLLQYPIKMSKTIDQQVYERLTQGEQGEAEKPPEAGTALMVHLVLKVIPLCLLLIDGLLKTLFNSDLVVTELILIFVVVDFWATKNITGKRLLGIRWYFDSDRYGVQHFMFQTWANEEHAGNISSKLFWILQLAYCIFPVVFLFTTVVVAPTITRIDTRKVMLNVAILVGGVSNFFFFWRASSNGSERQHKLSTTVGTDFVRKMKLASIVSPV